MIPIKFLNAWSYNFVFDVYGCKNVRFCPIKNNKEMQAVCIHVDHLSIDIIAVCCMKHALHHCINS